MTGPRTGDRGEESLEYNKHREKAEEQRRDPVLSIIMQIRAEIRQTYAT